MYIIQSPIVRHTAYSQVAISCNRGTHRALQEMNFGAKQEAIGRTASVYGVPEYHG